MCIEYWHIGSVSKFLQNPNVCAEFFKQAAKPCRVDSWKVCIFEILIIVTWILRSLNLCNLDFWQRLLLDKWSCMAVICQSHHCPIDLKGKKLFPEDQNWLILEAWQGERDDRWCCCCYCYWTIFWLCCWLLFLFLFLLLDHLPKTQFLGELIILILCILEEQLQIQVTRVSTQGSVTITLNVITKDLAR